MKTENQVLILDDLPYSKLGLVSHLIFYEGPYLSHFKDATDTNVLFQWCDVTETHNRWIVFAASVVDIRDYLQKVLSQKELLLRAEGNRVFLVDINETGAYDAIKAISAEQIPKDYWPSSDSYFDESLSPFIGDGYAYLLGQVHEMRRELVSIQECEKPIEFPTRHEPFQTISEKIHHPERTDLSRRFPEQWYPEITNSSFGKELLPC